VAGSRRALVGNADDEAISPWSQKDAVNALVRAIGISVKYALTAAFACRHGDPKTSSSSNPPSVPPVRVVPPRFHAVEEEIERIGNSCCSDPVLLLLLGPPMLSQSRRVQQRVFGQFALQAIAMSGRCLPAKR